MSGKAQLDIRRFDTGPRKDMCSDVGSVVYFPGCHPEGRAVQERILCRSPAPSYSDPAIKPVMLPYYSGGSLRCVPAEYTPFPKMALAGNPADYFALNVVGYSMVEVGVNEGDLVIVRRTTEPVWGNIMLVSYLGGLSLKWAVRYGGAACLRCGNGLRVDICNYQIEGELEWGIKRYKWG